MENGQQSFQSSDLVRRAPDRLGHSPMYVRVKKFIWDLLVSKNAEFYIEFQAAGVNFP
jgi:hypothetical protein